MKKKQPKAKLGYEFTGWAPVNWGLVLDRVFRTRKEAKEWCVDRSGVSWDNIKDHYTLAKVKVKVIKP